MDDSQEDVDIVVRVLKSAGLTVAFHHCWTGDEAMNFLRQRGEYADTAAVFRPSLVLLDLNLPGSDGRDVLQEIKNDRELRSIPVIVLTTSRDERDVRWCYQAGANSFIQKPVGLDAMTRALRGVVDYWFATVLLPSAE